MPYIKLEDREKFKEIEKIIPTTSGELNYCVSKLCLNYLKRFGLIKYQFLNDIIGALDCAKEEFRRRVVNPFEDNKIRDNSDIY